MAPALTACLLLGVQTQPSVTFSGRPQSVAKVLAAVSTSVGKALKADPDASREIVLIDVHDVLLDQFTAKLAQVTLCKWSRDGDRLTLKADVAKRIAEEDKELPAKAEVLKREIQAFASNSDKSEEQRGEVATGDEVLANVLEHLDPLQLAHLRGSDRLVWATNNPTATQGLLSDGAMGPVAEWVDAHDQVVRASLSNPQTDGNASRAVPHDLMLLNPPGKALLVGSWPPFQDTPELNLYGYDNTGKKIIRFEGGLPDLAKPTSAPILKPGSGSTPIGYSEACQALKTLIHESLGTVGLMPLKLPQALEEVLQRPDRFDWLSLFISDEIDAIARHEHLQLIADLPDSIIGEITADGPPATVEAAEQALNKREFLDGEAEGGFLTLYPAKPMENLDYRVDRSSLTALIAATLGEGQASLDDVSAYALRSPSLMEDDINLLFAMLFDPSILGDVGSWGASWNLCRFYGSLAPGQRVLLRSGARLDFAQLSAEQQRYASSFLFQAPGFQPSEGEPIPPELNAYQGIELEPTEAMPHGLPAKGFVSCSVTTEPVLLIGGKGFSQVCLGPEDIARLRYTLSDPSSDANEKGRIMQMPQAGKLGTRSILHFTFHVSPRAVYSSALPDVSFTSSGSPASLASLPSDFEKLVQHQLAEMKNQTAAARGAAVVEPRSKP